MKNNKRFNIFNIGLFSLAIISILGCGSPTSCAPKQANIFNNDGKIDPVKNQNDEDTDLEDETSDKPEKEDGEDEIGVIDELPILDLANYNVGDIITFGKYEQDNDLNNGSEDISWRILAIEDDRALLISEIGLDCKKYNEERVDITWENCTLRKWLNNDFYNSAFSSLEQSIVLETTLHTEDNPQGNLGNTPGGNDTNDKVFCLSLDEVTKYFGEYTYYDELWANGGNQKVICECSKYAESNGVEVIEIGEKIYSGMGSFSLENYGYTRDILGIKAVEWWTRTPGPNANSVSAILFDGTLGYGSQGRIVDRGDVSVRPAIYVRCK